VSPSVGRLQRPGSFGHEPEGYTAFTRLHTP
jgi:hypothetical protein